MCLKHASHILIPIVNVMGYIDLIPFLMTFIFKENVKQISKKKVLQ